MGTSASVRLLPNREGCFEGAGYGSPGGVAMILVVQLFQDVPDQFGDVAERIVPGCRGGFTPWVNACLVDAGGQVGIGYCDPFVFNQGS